MKKNHRSKAGAFNARILFAFTLCAAGSLLAMLSFASPASPAAPSSFGGPDPTTPGAPRYQIFASSVNPGFGEFNIGFNPATGRIMTMNSGPIWRITPAELLTPARPECCAELWENKSSTTTSTGLDPILWTDQKTRRTFASNSTAGANVVYAYSDNDGDTWIPIAVSPPNGGVDHETIGSGPYPAALPWSALSNPVNQGQMVFYCSQDLIGSMCQRSDDLGASYGPGVASTGPGTVNSQGCGSIHGHVRVAPDGTAWLADKSCGSSVGGAFSIDVGTTPWIEFSIPGSNASSPGSDPSIAFDENSTAYVCYVNGENGDENHAHVAVGKRNGSTIDWIRDVDLGASPGIVNVVFPEAVGGSAGRAACGFLGTNVPGNFQGPVFTGDWYLFIATTYDEGQNWVTVNATPNDPVQRQAGVCLGGLGCDSTTAPRNLEDFNEVTMDDKGRVLFGYSDGCVSSSCIAGASGNDDTATMRVARQIGGRTLLAQFDVSEPVVPKAPCLSGTRNTSGVHLTWKAPDNGGAGLTSYAIYRGSASGAETLLLATGKTGITFNDITADPAQSVFYYVRAINSASAAGGANSNEVTFGPTGGIQLLGITSSKVHGGAGTFGVDLPLNGSGIECRSGGASGDYTMVFNFANPVASVDTAAIAAGTGSISSRSIQNGDYVVNLTGVTNAQRITVTLTGVTDSAGNSAAPVSATMGVLIGDTTANGSVNSSDIGQAKSNSGQSTTAANFRTDVTVNGAVNSSDIGTVKAQSGTSLSP